MIVRYGSDDSLMLITQNDHAKLSGLMAAHWGNERFAQPRPYDSVVRATHYHDLGWLEYETSPRLDTTTGKTPNFLEVPNDRKHLQAFDRSHEWLTSIDLYAGSLITKHRTGVYQQRYGVLRQPTPPPRRQPSAELQEYLSRSESEQKTTAAGIDPREFAVNYKLLQVWDLLSLWVCCNDTLKEISVEPVPTGYGDGEETCVQFKPASPTSISVDPFPFDQSSLSLNVVYRRLPGSRFKDAQAFHEAIFGASPLIATFTFFNPAQNPAQASN
jgi:hypothetical protein